MESRAQVALGVFIVVIGVVMGVFQADGLTDVAGLLGAVAYVVAGILFAVAGMGRTVEVGNTVLVYRHFVGIACLLIAAAFAPTVWETLSGDTADVAYGVASGIGAVGLLVLGVLFLTGRIERA